MNSERVVGMRFSVCKIFFVLVLTATVAGCGEIAAVEGASTIVSDKTVSDHVVSLFSGKNCSTVRLEQGKTYCVEDEAKVNHDTLYCYKTLADVVCYQRADHRADPASRVGLNDHNAAQ